MSRNGIKSRKADQPKGDNEVVVEADEKTAGGNTLTVEKEASSNAERPDFDPQTPRKDNPASESAGDEEEVQEAVGWSIQLTRGRVVDVTDRHVVLSDDSLGFITFDDGEALSIEGIRRIGW